MVKLVKLCPARTWCPYQLNKGAYYECLKKGRCRVELTKCLEEE